MRIIQSFWTKPLFSKLNYNDHTREAGGWFDRRYLFMAIAYSALQLREGADELILYTDRRGSSLLVDKIGLPYTCVQVELDALNDIDPLFWSAAKIYTYGRQQEPFLHLDYDLMISPKLLSQTVPRPLICLHKECDHINEFVFNTVAAQAVARVVLEKLDGQSVNAGAIGGTDVHFFRGFSEEAMWFIKQNTWLIQKDFIHPKYVNRYVDQMLFYQMASTRGREIHFMLNDVNARKDGLGAVYRYPEDAKVLHLTHEYRRSDRVCEQLALRLETEYPEFYNRIMSLRKSGEL